MEVENSQGKDFFHDILLFKEGKRYSEDRNTRECTEYVLTDKFRPIHIPENGTFDGEFYLGSSSSQGSGVLAESWSGKTTNPNGAYSDLVTDKGCIPVHDIFVDEDDPQIMETFFYDVVAGISDPNVFVPPKDCQPGK